jgi:hypothetical protein
MYVILAINKIIQFLSKVDWGKLFSGISTAITGAFESAINWVKNINWASLGNGLMNFIKGLLRGIASGIPGADTIVNPLLNKLPKFAKGGDFIVPPGYPNDSYLMRVQSGERVIVQTPTQQMNNNSTNNSGNTINYINYGDQTRPNGLMPLFYNY